MVVVVKKSFFRIMPYLNSYETLSAPDKN